ncbi:hypothetical protein WKT22_03011 [Candidatus Lokiarchaeum ossiferum]
MILDENELTMQYHKYLTKYQDIFKHDPYVTFNNCMVNDSQELNLDFREKLANSAVLSITNEFTPISAKIIEFTTILTFLSPETLRNIVIYNLLFVFFFKNSKNIEIVKKNDEIVSEIKSIFKQVVQAQIHFVDAAFQIIPLKSILTEFLVQVNPTISYIELIDNMRVYYTRYLLSTLNYSDVRLKIQQQKILPEWFQSQKKIKQKNPLKSSSSTILSNLIVTMALHYEKVGLNLYFINVHFPNSSNTVKIIKKYFLPVPFLIVFFLSQKRFFTFYAIMPEKGLINLEKYLNQLKNIDYISDYIINLAVSSNQIIQLNKKYSGNIRISEMNMFSSKEYSKTTLNKRRNSALQENLAHFQDTVDYSIGKPKSDSNLRMNSLFLYIFFKSRVCFTNFSNFESIHLFLKYLKQDISNSPFSSIARNYPKIKSFKTHFEKDQFHFLNSSVEKKLKSGSNRKYLKYLRFLKDLGFKNNRVIYNSNFDKIIRSPWSDIVENFGNKTQYSREILGNHIYRLLKEGFIQESNIMSMTSILQVEKSTLPFFVTSKKFIDWIQKVSFYHVKSDFQEVQLNSNKIVRQQFFISVSSYFLIFKWLLLEDLNAVYLVFEQFIKRVNETIINFFDFKYTNQWNSHLFSLDYLVERKKKRNNRLLTQQIHHKPFHLEKNIKNKKFNFKNFYRDLNINSKLNEIAKHIKSKSNQFKHKLSAIYRSNSLQITTLKENLSLSKEQKILFDSSFCNNIALNPALSSDKRIILIFNQPNSDLSPFLFLKDPLLQGFFQVSLVNGWMFGGRYDATLILEYRKNVLTLENKNSEWNRFINNVKSSYPNLKINMFEISEEERFFNKKAFFPEDWRDSEYLNFSPSNNLAEEKEFIEKIYFNFEKNTIYNDYPPILKKYLNKQNIAEEERQSLLRSKILYYPRFFNWKFLQITGYSFSFILIISNPEKKKVKILDLLYQLPIGKIFHLQNKSEKSSKLYAILHLHENILKLWSKFVSFLENMRVDYIISPIFPLEVYDSTIIAKIINDSNIPIEFKFKNGEPIELPIFPLQMRREVYTPEEQICFFNALKEKYSNGKTDITRSRWIKILRDLKILKVKSHIHLEAIARILE